jgi:methionyl-tRNA formyltransferase
MKILFMGTPEFAIKTLLACMNAHEVIGVFTQPDKPKGRGKKMAFSPVKEIALEAGIPVYQPERIKKDDWDLKILEMKPDIIVVVAYGQILSERIINAAPYGTINVHASLLPKYRGAALINWAIVKGEVETGITTMQMNIGLDTGDMLLKESIKIDAQMTAGELHDELSEMGASLLLKTLIEIENGTIVSIKQDDGMSTYAPMIQKKDALIDWNTSAKEINQLIRGFNPWPVAYTFYEAKRMRIYESIVLDGVDEAIPAGTIYNLTPEGICVQTGSGKLQIQKIQFDNGKIMSVASFLLGHEMKLGQILREM